MAFSFPSEIGSAQFEWWRGVSFGLGCIEVETEEGVDMRALCGWAFVMQFRERVVDFSDLWGFDKEKNSLKCTVVVVLVQKPGPVSGWYGYKYVVEQVISRCRGSCVGYNGTAGERERMM